LISAIREPVDAAVARARAAIGERRKRARRERSIRLDQATDTPD